VLRGAVREATEAFLAVFDGYTLADLIKPQAALSALLFGSPRGGGDVGTAPSPRLRTEG
jgi:hypothetical protein